jgi:isoquinoline 1-oxidoreductase
VQIDAAKGDVRVLRAVTAFECGAVVNPDHLKNQIEGAVMMGIGGALFERIDFADGKILNPSFAEYRLPRFKNAPLQEVVLLDRRDLPSVGAGETPIIAIAPAIGNAVRAATGVRLRSLPLVPDGFKPA